MVERTLEYVDKGYDVKLVVTEATVLSGMKRAVLAGFGLSYLKAHGYGFGDDGGKKGVSYVELSAQRVIAQSVYPDLLAVTKEAVGLDLDMSVEEFMELPDGLTGVWSDLVYELNPLWLPRAEEETEAVKKGDKPSDTKSEDG